jgi:hypothetical protein
VISSFIIIVIGVVAGIYTYRFQLQAHSSTYAVSSYVASILNTLQITIFNMIYSQVAKLLTNAENHRTDTKYEDSLIVKMFVFQFINSFASFFFIAFIASNLDRPSTVPHNYRGQCGAENCMQPLCINLAIIFGSRLTVTNMLDIAIPYYNHTSKIKKETKGVTEGTKLSPAENDYMLMPYDNIIDNINSFADTAVQYGFTLLFITAFPIASFMSFVNTYAKVKFQTWKLCTVSSFIHFTLFFNL